MNACIQDTTQETANITLGSCIHLYLLQDLLGA